jgi:hypothetical protein
MAYSPASSTFPTAKTTFVDPTATSSQNTFDHAGLESAQNDGIEKLETAVGITASADTASLNYKLTNASQSNPGHKHTVADGATDVTSSAAELNQLDGVTVGGTSSGDIVDLDTAQTLATKTLTSPVLNGTLSGTAFLDQDAMDDDSAIAVASQQSIKAYVDASAGGSTTGWTSDSDTWVYASAQTFTIAGKDVTTTFTKGTRLIWTQTTVKYGVVVASSFSTDTTVTIMTNTDYTIANAAITVNSYSYQQNPQGYPTWFDIAAPTWTGLDDGAGGQPSVSVCRGMVNGNTFDAHIHLAPTKAGTSNTFYLETSDTVFPVWVNRADRSGLGFVYSQTSGDSNNLMTAFSIGTKIYTGYAIQSSITDNTAWTHMTYNLKWEI